MDTNKIFEFVNNKQKEAIVSIDGPVMAIAGAGSGKTTVLTKRFANMVAHGIEPNSILTVTFTNKAASEMLDRINKMLGADFNYGEIKWVGTFHSICNKIMRQEARYLPDGLTKNFEIIDAEDAKAKIKETIKTIEEECANTFDAKQGDLYYDLLRLYNYDVVFDEDVYSPSNVQDVVSKIKNGVGIYLGRENQIIYDVILKRYNQLLREDNCVDFDDMLSITYHLLLDNPELLIKYQHQFKYVMVDEFQDTNNIQYDLISLIARNHKNLFIVGDEDQSIYSFRGSNIKNIKNFMNDFRGYKQIILDENYRSTGHILNAANDVISYNTDRIEKNLFTSKGDGNLPTLNRYKNSFDEREDVVATIKRKVDNGECDYKDCAILYRLSSMSRNIEEELLKKNVPYKVFGGMSYFARKEVKDIVAYLRVIALESTNSLKRVINVPSRKIGKVALEKLLKASKTKGKNAFNTLPDTGNASMNDFYNIILEIKHAIPTLTHLSTIVDLVLDKTGYKDALLKDKDGKERLNNVLEFKSVINEAELNNQSMEKMELLELVLQDVALRTDGDEQSDDDDYVRVMTIHQAKGLEYENVWILGMEESLFPFDKAVDEGELEEERRLCYVAITRAKKNLYMTHCAERSLYGKIMNNADSCFLDEIDPDHLNIVKKASTYRNNYYGGFYRRY